MHAQRERETERGGGRSKHMREIGGGGIHKRKLLTFYAN